MFRWFLFPLLIAAAFLASARATTLPSLTEDDQIQKAKTIFRGRAEQVDAARETSARGQAIVTTVRFTPLAVYKGAAASPVSLRFLGGKVGDLEMKVRGMPQFQIGQEYILFLSAEGNAACPVVGWAEGSLKVDRQANAAGVVTVSPDVAGSIERSVSARTRTVLAGGRAGLTDFESRLRKRISDLSGQP